MKTATSIFTNNDKDGSITFTGVGRVKSKNGITEIVCGQRRSRTTAYKDAQKAVDYMLGQPTAV